MQTIIERILDKIDRRALEEELAFLREKDAELDAIREDVQEAKKGVSFWDKVNVFVSTEGEQELKDHKRALKESRKDHNAIIHNIKLLIREAIDLDPFVRMKMYLGELANDVDRLRIERSHGHAGESHANHFRIQGVDEVYKGIEQLDIILTEEAGLQPGKMDEAAVVGLVYDDILRSAGFID